MKCTTLSLLSDYYETDAGRLLAMDVLQSITNSINMSSGNLLAIGIGGGYLDELDTGKLLYAIPKSYPFKHWPKIRPFRTVVVDETALPFMPNSIDAIVLIHMMEFSEENSALLQDVFRILKVGGKLIVVSINKNNYNYFHKYGISEKCIKHSVEEIIKYISNASFCISSVFGINRKLRFWPYSFSYNFNKYNELLISFFPFLSDLVVIMSEQIEFAAETVKTLDTQYESL